MIRVDYAGPGGACEGIRMLGLTPVGIEWDAAACSTRAAAGHLTIRADLAHYRTPARFTGYWASPPCQTFSVAGKGDGRDQIDDLAAVIHAGDWSAAERFDDRTRHVIDACRTAEELHPEWVAFEQVPAVAPLWRAFGHRLEAHGYSTWTGILCAADYGVPQTRRRAILMASRVRPVASPPPTHAETPGLFGEQRWVSMADALGWGYEPSATVTADGTPFADAKYRRRLRQYVVDRRQTGAPIVDVGVNPSPTLTCAALGAGVWQVTGDGSPIRLTVPDALILQSFDPSYPVQGSRSKQFEQVGNAVPPLLAAHVVAALTGRQVPA